MFSPTGTGISTGICWKAESRNGPCRGPFLQSFRGKLFQGKSFLTPVKLRIKSVEVFGVKALLNEPEGFTETLEMDNLSCPQEADGVRHIGIPDCSEDVIVGRPGLLFCSHVFRQIGNDISLGLELAGIKRNAPGSLRPERRGVVNVIRTEAGVFDFFHGQVFGELIDDGADHFEMSEFVGTLRLSVIFIQVNSEIEDAKQELGGIEYGTVTVTSAVTADIKGVHKINKTAYLTLHGKTVTHALTSGIAHFQSSIPPASPVYIPYFIMGGASSRVQMAYMDQNGNISLAGGEDININEWFLFSTSYRTT